jgi:predicted Zn finger-like uncharacterized protein
MQFECDSCHAKYKISDDKVRGRVVRFPCRKCEHKILIDGRRGDADVTVPAGAAYNFDEVTRKSEPASSFSKHEAATARARRPSSPVRRRPPSVPPPRRASAAARRISSVPVAARASHAMAGVHPGLAPPVPASSSSVSVADPFAATQAVAHEVPEWHVSVNDVPIGPIRLEEMAHKIDAGAVSEYSLVWREGFEEWRPLATVPELMSLLYERRHSGPPARSTFSSMPPFVETRVSVDELPASQPLPTPPSSFPSSPALASVSEEIAPLADTLQPELPPDAGLSAMSQPPAPLGPEGVFASSPSIGSYSGLPPKLDDEVSVPPVPPEPAAATAEPEGRMSLGILALIIAVAVFSGVVAFLAFDRYGEQLLEQWVGASKSSEPVKAAPAPAPEPEPVAEAAASEPLASGEEEVVADGEELAEGDEAAAEAEAEGALAEDGEGEAAEAAEVEKTEAAFVAPPDPKDNAPKIAPAPRPKPRARRRPRTQPKAAPVAAKAEKSDASEEDQKLLDEFGSSADTAPAKIAVKESGSTQSKKPALDGAAVRSTVTANKPKLQRCYERAIRGQQSPTAVRLDVTVTVAPSGRVKNVSSEGSGPGGLAECIEASVRRWRFPESAEGGPARFPIVFSAN